MEKGSPENLLVVSDLHLNEGWVAASDAYSSREDFFYDDDIFELLKHHDGLDHPAYQGRPWLLIFNGDTFDFEQVIALPEEGEELLSVCSVESYAELGERARFGLETSSEEARWKLQCIVKGHTLFFAALGWFIARGHRVMFIKGNHDPELYWPAVRLELRCSVLRAYRAYRKAHPAAPELTPQMVKERVQFEPWFYYDTYLQVYVEHGNQYEPSNHFTDYVRPVSPEEPEHLDLPDGMMMTRYVFNRLEESYPYADNVRPVTRAFGWMLSDDPLGGSLIFLQRAGDMLLGWKKLWQRKQRHAAMGEQLIAQQALPKDPHGGMPDSLVAEIQQVARRRAQFSWKVWGGLLVDQGVLGLLSLAGIGTGIWGVLSMTRRSREKKRGGVRCLVASMALLNVAHFWSAIVNDDWRLDYMPAVATALAKSFRQAEFPLRVVCLGHTHIARREWLDEQKAWLINTGTWIPTLVQYPHQWEGHMTFARIAAGGPAEEVLEIAPEFLEWDPRLCQPKHPRAKRASS